MPTYRCRPPYGWSKLNQLPPNAAACFNVSEAILEDVMTAILPDAHEAIFRQDSYRQALCRMKAARALRDQNERRWQRDRAAELLQVAKAVAAR